MSLLYADTSALFKRYVTESGSSEVAARMAASTRVGTALITWAEITAAFARAIRTSRMEPHEARTLVREFRVHWSEIATIPITGDLVEHAAALAWKHGLRGYDAIQLAAALDWQETLVEANGQITFASFDNALRRAAAAERLDVWPELPLVQPWGVSDEWNPLFAEMSLPLEDSGRQTLRDYGARDSLSLASAGIADFRHQVHVGDPTVLLVDAERPPPAGGEPRETQARLLAWEVTAWPNGG